MSLHTKFAFKKFDGKTMYDCYFRTHSHNVTVLTYKSGKIYFETKTV